MQPGPLHVAVLGPLVARRGDMSVTPSSPMLRALLGLLAVQPHRVVSRDEIVDTLWGEDPPKSCLASVHVYIGRLRTLLDPERERRSAGLLSASGSGYVFAPAPEQLDLLEFEALLERAKQAEDTLLFAAALEQWRGPVLAGLGPRLERHPAATAVNSHRIAAALVLAEGALRLGTAAQAVPLLRAVAHDDPLHEGLHARLILALGASGQQAAALSLFTEVRDRLSDELGVSPGRELTDAHMRVLRHDLPAAPVPETTPVRPQQLPADVRGFTGRADVLAELDAALLGEGEAVVTVTGTAGVGKSAVAVRWAQRSRPNFPDGQLFINLRGHSPTPPLRPIDALAQLLRALGVAPDQVPADLDEAASMYRSLLTDKRILVVLDNAQSADQVRPLLPGGAECRTVVTSRDQLLGLTAIDGARPVSIDVLTPGEAHALLTGIVGVARVQAEPDAAAELARACAYLPLALRIAAANLAGQPRSGIGRYLERLRAENRLAALTVAGDEHAAVRAAFDLSYNALPPAARRLFRLLGPAPGSDIALEAASALADLSVDDTYDLLDVLAAAHLVTAHATDRYTLHDLLRLYAAEQCQAEENAYDRREAIRRLYDWYTERVRHAVNAAYPERVRLPALSGAECEPWEPSQAVGWLETERSNLLAAVVHAGEHGQRARAPMLADALRGHFANSAPAIDWLALAEAALAAAEQERDAHGTAAAHLSLAELYWRASDAERSIEHHRLAAARSREAEWLAGEAAALGNLGGVCRLSGRLAEAVEHFTESLKLNRRTGRVAGEAATLGGLATALRDLGRFEEAAEHLCQALELFRRIGSAGGEAVALENLGDTYVAMGRYEEAGHCLEEALEIFAKLGNRTNEALAKPGLAMVRAAAGQLDVALELAQSALELGRNTCDRRVSTDSLIALGSIHLRLGDHDTADECFRNALQLSREARIRYAEAVALTQLAESAADRRDERAAAQHAQAALAVADACGFGWLQRRARAVLAAPVTPN